jgi:Tfp pilus assembly protein PilX
MSESVLMDPGASTAMSRTNPRARSQQRGVVLFTALVLLVILTLVGVMLSRLQTVEERISQNDEDHQLAVQAAEATLRYAEFCLFSGQAPCSSAAFAAIPGGAGAYTWQSGQPDAWQVNNPFPPTNSPATAFLQYGGVGLPAAAPLPVVGVPEFLIEQMPATAMPGMSLSLNPYGQQIQVFRITAYSYGGDTNATAELQEIDWND